MANVQPNTQNHDPAQAYITEKLRVAQTLASSCE